MMLRVVSLMMLAMLLVGCGRALPPAPVSTLSAPTPGVLKHESRWAVAAFSRDKDGANVYSMNTENGRVCEYLFFTLDGASPPKRLVDVTCSSADDTADLSATK